MTRRTFVASLITTMTLAGCASIGSTERSEAHTRAQDEVTRLKRVADENALLKEWTGAYGGLPPWDRADPALIPDALRIGIELQTAEVEAIAANPDAPSFANTLVALQNVGRHLDRATTIFGVMTDNVSTPAIQDLEATWSPRLAAASNAITFNRGLFERIETLYQRRASLGLNAQDLRLLERTRDQFVRAGAAATPEQQARLGAISEELSAKFAEFSRRLLNDENTAVFITREADLEGLPQNMRDAFRAAATERNRPNAWAVVNTRSSVDPFLTFSANRALREQVWRAFKNRGDNGDANDTNAIIADIMRLRAERARLLGFQNHAYLRMADTMAQTPANAQNLMMRVWPAAVARVREEVADMQAIANRQNSASGANITIEPWDYLFYAEQVRRERYNLDQNELRPYFELGNMTEAAFFMANQLYGFSFRDITGTVPVFEQSVRVWEVTGRDGAFVGLFYGDYFARGGKRSGAWMTTYRLRENFTGQALTTIASNNNNFTRGAAGEPVLISLDDAETLFHEFGHALHYLSLKTTYPAFGTTPRDYVEFPSQVHEHWVLTRPILDRFARHYQTREPMPQALVDRVHSAETFNQGYNTVEYLACALVDMSMHNRPEPITDIDGFEREELARIGMPREVALRHRLPQFSHLFSSDAYSAGYYSYLWSEVMDADAWEYFESTGNVFDPGVAAKMQDIILAEGNQSDRAEAYRRFRGRDPDVNALLRVRGFPTN